MRRKNEKQTVHFITCEETAVLLSTSDKQYHDALHACDEKYLHELIYRLQHCTRCEFACINHREIRGKWTIILVSSRRTIPPTEYIKS